MKKNISFGNLRIGKAFKDITLIYEMLKGGSKVVITDFLPTGSFFSILFFSFMMK